MRDLNAKQKEDYLWEQVAEAVFAKDYKALSVASTRMYYYYKKKEATQLKEPHIPTIHID